MIYFENRHEKWWNKDWFPALLQFCFKFNMSTWPVFRFWCRQAFPCCLYNYKEYTLLFYRVAWKAQHSLSSKQVLFPRGIPCSWGSPTQPDSWLSGASLFYFVYICVCLLLFLFTPGKWLSFWVCQKHMGELLFKTTTFQHLCFRLLLFSFQLPVIIWI